MKKHKTQRVVGSADEARQAAEAERMKNKGGGFTTEPDAAFRSVYGDTNPQSFSIAEDAVAMQGAGMMSNEQVAAAIGPQAQPDIPMETAGGTEAPAPAPMMMQPLSQAEIDAQNAAMEAPPQGAQPPLEAVTNMGPDNPEPPKEEEKPQKPLTTAERLERLSKYIHDAFKDSETPVPIPSPQLLAQWKQMHGDIHMLHLNDRIFLFRYLKRQEYVQMVADPKWEGMTELQREDLLFEKCVLYPAMDQIQKAGTPANTMGMIAAQIKMQSLFLDEMYVAQLVLKI